MMKPTVARAFWFALLENAALTIVDADALYPSPRAQSLVVIAQEEVGKAVWVQNTFRQAWNDEDETPREVPELVMMGLHHLAKLTEAFDFSTISVQDPISGGHVDIETVRELDSDFLATYFECLASEDNEAKKRGFHIDDLPGGLFVVPHELDRPRLRAQICEAADMVMWCLSDDRFL